MSKDFLKIPSTFPNKMLHFWHKFLTSPSKVEGGYDLSTGWMGCQNFVSLWKLFELLLCRHSRRKRRLRRNHIRNDIISCQNLTWHANASCTILSVLWNSVARAWFRLRLHNNSFLEEGIGPGIGLLTGGNGLLTSGNGLLTDGNGLLTFLHPTDRTP